MSMSTLRKSVSTAQKQFSEANIAGSLNHENNMQKKHSEPVKLKPKKRESLSENQDSNDISTSRKSKRRRTIDNAGNTTLDTFVGKSKSPTNLGIVSDIKTTAHSYGCITASDEPFLVLKPLVNQKFTRRRKSLNSPCGTSKYSSKVRPTLSTNAAKKSMSPINDPKIWTDLYLPSSLSEMLLNSSGINDLVSWVKSWDSRTKLCANKNSSKKKARKNASYLDSDYSEDSWDSCASGSSSSWRHLAYLIIGPTGCGKTSLVYALASQFGFKVFEINPSVCRSGKEVTSLCAPVFVSQQVSTDGLSASASVPNLKQASFAAGSGRFNDKRPRKPTIASFFQPRQPSISKTSSNLEELAAEGLKLNNKSLILLDEVDNLFEADRGFWGAVGKLLQMGRRPIFFTASDPTVILRIPVPFRTCRLLPLLSPTLAKPVLQRICDAQEVPLTGSLIESLTRRECENTDDCVVSRVSSTAKWLVESGVFYDFRKAVLHLQWLTLSGNVEDHEKSIPRDILSSCGDRFHRLFSLSLDTRKAHVSTCSPKPCDDDFEDIFAVESENEPPDNANKAKSPKSVRLNIVESKRISADTLTELSRITDLQSILDVFCAVSTRNEVSRGLRALPQNLLSSSYSGNLFSVVGDAASAPLSGVDPESCSSSGAFAWTEDWWSLLNSTAERSFVKLQENMLAATVFEEPSANDTECGVYYPVKSNESVSPSNTARASGTLLALKALSEEKRTGESCFQRDLSTDFLPALRTIQAVESLRKGVSTRRRFFHYFDQIGLRLSEEVRSALLH